MSKIDEKKNLQKANLMNKMNSSVSNQTMMNEEPMMPLTRHKQTRCNNSIKPPAIPNDATCSFN